VVGVWGGLRLAEASSFLLCFLFFFPPTFQISISNPTQITNRSVQHSSLLIGCWRVFLKAERVFCRVLESVWRALGGHSQRLYKHSFNSRSKGWNVLVQKTFGVTLNISTITRCVFADATCPPSAAAGAAAGRLPRCTRASCGKALYVGRRVTCLLSSRTAMRLNVIDNLKSFTTIKRRVNPPQLTHPHLHTPTTTHPRTRAHQLHHLASVWIIIPCWSS
jgi:hypothetical protein